MNSELDVLKHLHATAADLASIRRQFGHHPLIREALQLFAQFADSPDNLGRVDPANDVDAPKDNDTTLLDACGPPTSSKAPALDFTPSDLLDHLRELAREERLISYAELDDWLFCTDQSQKNRPQKVCDRLARHGIGVVPDPRDEVLQLTYQSEVILFDLGEAFEPSDIRSESFKLMSLKLTVAAMTARADEDIANAEIELMKSWVSNLGPSINRAEKFRLFSMITLLCQRAATFRARRSRFSYLQCDEREALLYAACSIAHADDHLDPREVQVLERIAIALELPIQLAHEYIFQMSFQKSKEKDIDDTERPALVSEGAEICDVTLSITKAESAKAQRVLASIFAA